MATYLDRWLLGITLNSGGYMVRLSDETTWLRVSAEQLALLQWITERASVSVETDETDTDLVTAIWYGGTS